MLGRWRDQIQMHFVHLHTDTLFTGDNISYLYKTE